MSRRSTVSVLAAIAATAVTLSVAPAGATNAVDRGRPSPAAGAVATHSERVLTRASSVLGGAPDTRGVDATLALRDLFLARPALGDSSAGQRADRILARPTDGAHDAYGDGYTVPSVMRCSAHICLHWVTSTADRPPSTAWVDTTLTTMEQVWRHHVDRLGYRAPPSDGSRGGNAKFDVYLKQLGSQGLYGYCAPERKVAGRPRAASGFCVLDNDFSRSEFHRAPIDALRVTAAHEFFHAIQFGYDFREDPWLLEATATWMEERFADSVNDNRMYLPYGQVGIPSAPLDTFDSAGFNQYGNWPFFEYLSEHYGNGIVRKIWQHLGNGKSAKDYSIQGVRQVLAHYGGLAAVFAAYAGGNTAPGHTYAEGGHFPATQMSATHRLSKKAPRWSFATHVDHLAAKDVQVLPDTSVEGRAWRLRISVDGPSAATSPAAYLVTRKKGHHVARHPIRLDRQGDGSITVALGLRTVTSVTITLANVSTRYACHRATTFSCAGRPRDDGRRFTLSAHAVKG